MAADSPSLYTPPPTPPHTLTLPPALETTATTQQSTVQALTQLPKLCHQIAVLVKEVLVRNSEEINPVELGYAIWEKYTSEEQEIEGNKKQKEGGKEKAIVEEEEDTLDAEEGKERAKTFSWAIDYADAVYKPTISELATLLPLTVIQEDTLSQIQGDTFRIRRASLEATPELPAFFVGYETANNKIIVSVRGTASLQDALTNLKLDTEPFMGGYAHAGMAELARNLVDNTYHDLVALRKTNPDAEIIFVGHSLGAGIASLAALLLHKNLHGIRCICFAAPACVCKYLSKKTEKLAMSLLYGSDQIHALSEHSMVMFLRDLQSYSHKGKVQTLVAAQISKYIPIPSLDIPYVQRFKNGFQKLVTGGPKVLNEWAGRGWKRSAAAWSSISFMTTGAAVLCSRIIIAPMANLMGRIPAKIIWPLQTTKRAVVTVVSSQFLYNLVVRRAMFKLERRIGKRREMARRLYCPAILYWITVNPQDNSVQMKRCEPQTLGSMRLSQGMIADHLVDSYRAGLRRLKWR